MRGLSHHSRFSFGFALMRLSWVPIFLVMAYADMAYAANQVFECKVSRQDPTYWIPKVVRISFDPETGDALVMGPIIARFNEDQPVPGGLATENAKRITFVWNLPAVRNAQGQYTSGFRFSGTYFKNTRKFLIASEPAGYEDRFSGRGFCKVSVE